MTAQPSIALQATIGGMSSRAGDKIWTVYGELDVGSGVLLVDVAKEHKPGTPEKRRAGCGFVTNNANAEDHDVLFTEPDLQDAIRDYYAFAGRGLLVIEDAIRSHDPESKIEADGMDEHGRKYRLSPDMTNGQIAVMVMCWFAARQSGFARQLEAFDDFFDSDVVSVGVGNAGRREARSYAMGGKLPIGDDGWPIE